MRMAQQPFWWTHSPNLMALSEIWRPYSVNRANSRNVDHDSIGKTLSWYYYYYYYYYRSSTVKYFYCLTY